VVDAQGDRRFLVGPSDACHIHQIPADEHRGRESGKKIPINVALHGSVRRPKVVPGGCDFHVFHDYPLVHATTRPDVKLSFHDLVASKCPVWRTHARNKKVPLLDRLVGACEQDRVGIARAAIPGRAAAGCDIHHTSSG
jgi:hypothetical protein